MTEDDGEFHNMSMLVGRDDSLGITFMTSPGSHVGCLENRLGLYSIAKNTRCAYGVGCLSVGAPVPLTCSTLWV